MLGAWLCRECAGCRSCKKHDDSVSNWKHVVVKPSAKEDADCIGNYLATYCNTCCKLNLFMFSQGFQSRTLLSLVFRGLFRRSR